MQCNPSTVSRKAESCAVSLGLLLRKRSGLWSLYGDTDLLLAERSLHQRYRLAGYGPLRLDLCADVGDRLAHPPHPAWSSGGQRHFVCRRPLQLLEQRVIDGWFCCFCEELPSEEDGSWLVLDLATVPLLLLAHREHPLAHGSSGNGLDPAALRDCPCLALPDHCLPRRQALMRRLGLAHQILPLERHDAGKWDEPLEDHRTIRPGTPLELRQRPDWRPVPLPLDHEVRLGLVVQRDLNGHAPVQELHRALQAWLDDEIPDGLSGAPAPRSPASPDRQPRRG
jgi:hypothetical protein